MKRTVLVIMAILVANACATTSKKSAKRSRHLKQKPPQQEEIVTDEDPEDYMLGTKEDYSSEFYQQGIESRTRTFGEH